MTKVGDLHDAAMSRTDEALRARGSGKLRKAQRLFKEAFALERRSAEMVACDPNAEPTRSVLLRSAAALALECQEMREAERLVATALAGNPPAEIADELRGLLERVNLSRHLQLRGKAPSTHRNGAFVTREGWLRMAEAGNGEESITIVTDAGDRQQILVPAGLLNDIVGPFWNHRVAVTCVNRNGRLELLDIASRELEARTA